MSAHDLQMAGAKASPPALYAATHLFGVSLPDWVAFATLVYILLQIADLLWKWRRRIHARASEG